MEHPVYMKVKNLSLKRLTKGRKNGSTKKNAKLQEEEMKINNEKDLDLKRKGTSVILKKKRKDRKKRQIGRLTIEDCGSGPSRKNFLL